MLRYYTGSITCKPMSDRTCHQHHSFRRVGEWDSIPTGMSWDFNGNGWVRQFLCFILQVLIPVSKYVVKWSQCYEFQQRWALHPIVSLIMIIVAPISEMFHTHQMEKTRKILIHYSGRCHSSHGGGLNEGLKPASKLSWKECLVVEDRQHARQHKLILATRLSERKNVYFIRDVIVTHLRGSVSLVQSVSIQEGYQCGI